MEKNEQVVGVHPAHVSSALLAAKRRWKSFVIHRIPMVAGVFSHWVRGVKRRRLMEVRSQQMVILMASPLRSQHVALRKLELRSRHPN